MTNDAFTIKQNDTSPSILYALTPLDVDLTGATVVFSMRDHQTGTLVVDRASAVIVTPSGTPEVRYDWAADDTAVSGLYEAEFEATYAGGAVETFPNAGYIPVHIQDDIA